MFDEYVRDLDVIIEIDHNPLHCGEESARFTAAPNPAIRNEADASFTVVSCQGIVLLPPMCCRERTVSQLDKEMKSRF